MRTKLIPDRAALPLATTIAAALLAGIMISGCKNSSGATPRPVTRSTTTSTAPGTLSKPSGSGPCYKWPGIGDLNAIALPMQQLASDEEIYGIGSDQANSDGMALTTAEMGLNQIVTQLPYPWAQAILDDVLSAGSASSPAQLDTAANYAWTLANEIDGMCYIPAY